MEVLHANEINHLDRNPPGEGSDVVADYHYSIYLKSHTGRKKEPSNKVFGKKQRRSASASQPVALVKQTCFARS